MKLKLPNSALLTLTLLASCVGIQTYGDDVVDGYFGKNDAAIWKAFEGVFVVIRDDNYIYHYDWNNTKTDLTHNLNSVSDWVQNVMEVKDANNVSTYYAVAHIASLNADLVYQLQEGESEWTAMGGQESLPSGTDIFQLMHYNNQVVIQTVDSNASPLPPMAWDGTQWVSITYSGDNTVNGEIFLHGGNWDQMSVYNKDTGKLDKVSPISASEWQVEATDISWRQDGKEYKFVDIHGESPWMMYMEEHPVRTGYFTFMDPPTVTIHSLNMETGQVVENAQNLDAPRDYDSMFGDTANEDWIYHIISNQGQPVIGMGFLAWFDEESYYSHRGTIQFSKPVNDWVMIQDVFHQQEGLPVYDVYPIALYGWGAYVYFISKVDGNYVDAESPERLLLYRVSALPILQSSNALGTGYVSDVDDNWVYFPYYGWVYTSSEPWMYFDSLGDWFYANPSSYTTEVYLWNSVLGWLYTSPDDYPWSYLYDSGTWDFLQ